MSSFLRPNLPAFLWGTLIVALTALPGSVIPEVPVFFDLLKPDKLVHVFLFGVYAFLQIHGFSRQETVPFIGRHPSFWMFACGTFLAAGTELMQAAFIPNRVGSAYDFMANMVGLLLGMALFRRIFNRKGAQSRNEGTQRSH